MKMSPHVARGTVPLPHTQTNFIHYLFPHRASLTQIVRRCYCSHTWMWYFVWHHIFERFHGFCHKCFKETRKETLRNLAAVNRTLIQQVYYSKVAFPMFFVHTWKDFGKFTHDVHFRGKLFLKTVIWGWSSGFGMAVLGKISINFIYLEQSNAKMHQKICLQR